MKIILLLFYVFICYQYGVSDLLTDLGSNVIINCDLDENEVYWILLKTAKPPTVILRTTSATTSPFYFNKSFIKKYSVQFKHRLVINNVTADELGVYYCMNTRTPPKLSNSTRIYFNESTQLTHNHTAVDCIDQNQTQHHIIIIISALMNGLLIIVVIVFAAGKTERLGKHFHADLQTKVTYQPQDPNQF
uniref:Si:dkey-208m12.3 n=1 Tax=Cyprinus carpio carpio TaxID=630221 RepID=A0A8C1BLM4_CYPCA